MTVQVAAMRALFELCQGLKTASEEQRAMVIDKLPGFINFITDIVTRAKNNILSELLLTIVAVTSVSYDVHQIESSKLLNFTLRILV